MGPINAAPNTSGWPSADRRDLDLIQKQITQATPPGCLQMYGAATAPLGWLLCDGSAISRQFYRTLFDVIGTSFGVGDGSTTFNVPDARGRVLVGLDNLGGADSLRLSAPNVMGGSGGAETHTLLSTEIPAHTHVQNLGGTLTNFAPAAGVGVGGQANTSTTAANSPAGGAHNNMQPYLLVGVIIKT